MAWIAKNDRVNDSSGPVVATDKVFYDPYDCDLPSPQASLLRPRDELGIPHKKKKQIHGSPLPIIGIDVDPNALSFALPDVTCKRLISELET